MSANTTAASVEPEPESRDFPLGAARAQLHNTYIVAETASSVVIVDQHAAHERLVYEKLKSALADGGIERQGLLIPEVVELDASLAGLRVILEDQSTRALPGELKETLDKLQATINGLSPDSELYRNLNASMLQLNRTLGNVENLTRTLQGQPNAAIMPTNLPPDPTPEARR